MISLKTTHGMRCSDFSIKDLSVAIFLGVVSALIVPLFFILVQSHLLSAILSDSPNPVEHQNAFEDSFIMLGFCIVAGFSSRAFLETVSTRVMNLATEANRRVAEVDSKLNENTHVLSEKFEVSNAIADSVSEAVENLPDLQSEQAPQSGTSGSDIENLTEKLSDAESDEDTLYPASDVESSVLADLFHNDTSRHMS